MSKLMMMIFTGKSSVDEHFPKVVWVTSHGEHGAEDEVLLDIRRVVEPDDAESESRTRLIILMMNDYELSCVNTLLSLPCCLHNRVNENFRNKGKCLGIL